MTVALEGITTYFKVLACSIRILSGNQGYELICISLLNLRCGGQGDLLSGSLAPLLVWAHNKKDCPEPGAGVIAGWAAARLSRACAAQAFSQHGRATTTSDLIAQLESAFSRLYESETCL